MANETGYAPDEGQQKSFNWFMKRTQPAAAEAAAGSQDLTRQLHNSRPVGAPSPARLFFYHAADRAGDGA
jgi:hypothetical protein